MTMAKGYYFGKVQMSGNTAWWCWTDANGVKRAATPTKAQMEIYRWARDIEELADCLVDTRHRDAYGI
jgi:hypothetical protein